MTKPVKSSPTGTLPCVRVISGAWALPPAAALVAAAVVRREALLPLRALLQVPARLHREAEVLAVEELLLHRSFLAANAGTPQNSLDALRNATATSYYKGDGSLWVKLVSAGVTGPGGRAVTPGNTIQVSR